MLCVGVTLTINYILYYDQYFVWLVRFTTDVQRIHRRSVMRLYRGAIAYYIFLVYNIYSKNLTKQIHVMGGYTVPL